MDKKNRGMTRPFHFIAFLIIKFIFYNIKIVNDK